MLNDGYTDVPAGKIAAVVTHLRISLPPGASPVTHHESLSVRRIHNLSASVAGRVGDFVQEAAPPHRGSGGGRRRTMRVQRQ